MSPFVKHEGKIILWKSMNIDRELQLSSTAQKELRCKLVTLAIAGMAAVV